MLARLKDLNSHSLNFTEKFLENCTVEEKIDAPYICINIKRNKFSFYRSGRKLTSVDIILNSDYSPMMKDWELFRGLNEEWFTAHGGCSIYVFYLPVTKPLGTEYKPDVRYIIDRIVYRDETIEGFDGMESLHMIEKFGIAFKNSLVKRESADFVEIATDFRSGKLTEEEVVRMISDAGQKNLFAVEEPEGFILRKGKKHIFQCLLSPTDDRHKEVTESARSQYEFLLLDFLKFWDSISDIYAHTDCGDYVKTVCSLFNDYCQWQKQNGESLKNNIEASGLEPPYIGRKPQTDFRHIPNPKTVELCRDDLLMENVLKVLLVNLQKEKRFDDCVLMNSTHAEKWNTIVKTLQNAGLSSQKS